MDILIGLIPAVSWGVLPLAVSKLGGKPINQILGTTLGALLVALIVQAASGQSASGTVFYFVLFPVRSGRLDKCCNILHIRK